MFASLSAVGLVLLPFALATVHDVTVGQPGGVLQFNPDAISAQPGDQVVFHFNPKNHSVTQSSFASPCGLKEGGFNSGFMPVAANTSSNNLPTFSIVVNDTQPIWVFCDQAANTPASHCGAGMVFAVNCGQDGSANSFTNFKAAAQAIGASLSASAAAAASTAASTAAGGYGSSGYGSGAGSAATTTYTAAYGDVTIPPPETASTVTQTITLESSTWTTTYASFPNSPAATPASLQGNVINVVVGGTGKLFFDPPHVSAQPRDIIVFQFEQKNHTVTQSAFADPCRPLSANGTTGFDSGFFPVSANATSFPTWNLTINDTAPIWAYCRQQTPVSHCGSGMVFAVNSDESSARNFTAFQNIAKALNGTNSSTTTSSSSSSSTPSPTPSNGAVSLPLGVASVGLSFVAILASLL